MTLSAPVSVDETTISETIRADYMATILAADHEFLWLDQALRENCVFGDPKLAEAPSGFLCGVESPLK